MRKEDETTMRLPSFDMLWISYKGDPEGTFSLVIPYCEVSNGQLIRITNEAITLVYQDKAISIPHQDFKDGVESALNDCNQEQGFPKKKIIRLSVQPKETADVIQIPISR